MTPPSSILLGDPRLVPGARASTPAPPAPPGVGEPEQQGGGRNNALTVIAGVGVLLLAMGVGVLIGRTGGTSLSPARQEVITENAPAASSGGAAGETAFTSSWPSGTHGYSVELKTLPESGTTVAEVQAAESAARAKGASGVGALKSSEFSSLGSGQGYVIYSGDYHTRQEAQKALTSLKKSFPSAKVIDVSNRASSSPEPSGSSSGAPGTSLTHPAPPTVLQKLAHAKKGKNYEQESLKLPDVVETG